MKNTPFYHAARELFTSLGMPDVMLAAGNAYSVVVDRRVEVKVVANGDDYLRLIAECGPVPPNLGSEQLMALLNCNCAMRPSSTARVGICSHDDLVIVHGIGRLDSDDPGLIRAVFDDVVTLADRVLAILVDPRDGEQARHRRAFFDGNCL